jgi:hypothetical protein
MRTRSKYFEGTSNRARINHSTLLIHRLLAFTRCKPNEQNRLKSFGGKKKFYSNGRMLARGLSEILRVLKMAGKTVAVTRRGQKGITASVIRGDLQQLEQRLNDGSHTAFHAFLARFKRFKVLCSGFNHRHRKIIAREYTCIKMLKLEISSFSTNSLIRGSAFASYRRAKNTSSRRILMKAKLMLSTIAASAFVLPAFAQDAAKPAADAKAKTVKTTRARGTAYVRLLHAIVGGPRVDVYVDGKKTLDDVLIKRSPITWLCRADSARSASMRRRKRKYC